MSITTINPTNGKIIQSYSTYSESEIKTIIAHTKKAQKHWKTFSLKQRSELLLSLADTLLAEKNELTKLIATEMGKPVSFAEKEIEKCAMGCRYYAEEGIDHLSPRHIETQHQKSYVSYQPLGLVFAIMPWNYPIWQVLRFAIPCLMAGNGVLLKHAPNVTACALAIEKIMKAAGLPEHLFRTLVIADERSEIVIADPAVAAVTLTGSPRAGKAVGQLASKHLKKSVLELGGNDPYVIFSDADLEAAVDAILFSRMNNSGQVCVAAKRIIAVDNIYDALKSLLLKRVNAVVMGDPLDPSTQFGPLARDDLRQHLHQQVQTSLEQGAECDAGGTLPDGKGFYYPATLLSGVKPGMVAFDEELFGPVISLIKANDETDAIELANNTPYGLGAAIFTQDIAKGERLARDEINAGCCFVNSFVASQPKLPFGGIKQSGFGRELSSEGIREFTNIKTVVVK